jgi:hypothetical protein
MYRPLPLQIDNQARAGAQPGQPAQCLAKCRFIAAAALMICRVASKRLAMTASSPRVVRIGNSWMKLGVLVRGIGRN